MRTFSSYGPVDTTLHYYAPRTALIDLACAQLLGMNPAHGGQYITVWGPRQTGKTWVMQQVVSRLKTRDDVMVGITTMQSAQDIDTAEGVLKVFVNNLRHRFQQDFPNITAWEDLPGLFTARYFAKPVIVILDEFDALHDTFINRFVNVFRSIYSERLNDIDQPSAAKTFLLHGLALIGVRSVLGVENVSGSPFNVQRSLHIPNLTYDEVHGMFRWYAQDSGQSVELAVIERLFTETQGQPGLVCWMGELLTETYNTSPARPITMAEFEAVYAAAVQVLPNNTITNIISKASHPVYKPVVLDLFKTNAKTPFTYDDRALNFLYTNGIIDYEAVAPTEYSSKFACPFIQKRLFNTFARELFPSLEGVSQSFETLEDTMTDTHVHIKQVLRRYETYVQQHHTWLFKDVPRRSTDLRIYEAVYHFNLFMYLSRFLESYGGRVIPEFPTGNGRLDLLITYAGQTYGVEVKSFSNQVDYRRALRQAAHYGRQLGLLTMSLVLFVEDVDDEQRRTYEQEYVDPESGVRVEPVFVRTGR